MTDLETKMLGQLNEVADLLQRMVDVNPPGFTSSQGSETFGAMARLYRVPGTLAGVREVIDEVMDEVTEAHDQVDMFKGDTEQVVA